MNIDTNRSSKIFLLVVPGMAASALVLALLWYRLGSQTFGKAAAIEQQTALAAGNWHTIFNNPLNAPYLIVLHAVRLLGHDDLVALRLVSTLFGALAAILFYIVALQWYSRRVALLASWLFVSSAWFLHTARLGSPEILWIVSMLAIVVVLTPNRHGRQNRLALPSTVFALTAVMYVPGMVWLVLTGLIIRRKNLREAWQATSSLWLRILTILGCLAGLAPLAYGLVRGNTSLLKWMGADPLGNGELPPLATIGRQIAGVPLNLLAHGSFGPVHWLDHLPLLGIFEIAMLLIGLYFYGSHLRAARTRLIILLAGIGWLIVGISGPTAISLLLPVIYLLAAAGIAYLLQQWFKVFPTNPLARGIGIAAVTTAILLTSVYQTRSYYVAWHYSPATSQAFQQKL